VVVVLLAGNQGGRSCPPARATSARCGRRDDERQSSRERGCIARRKPAEEITPM
jgi:hypothetical protein